MQTKTKTIILIVIILIATAGFGIYLFQKNRLVIPTPSSQNIEQSAVEENQQPEPEKTDFGTEMPTDFPTNIPLEKGAEVEQSYGLNYVDQKQLSIVFLSAKTVEENFALYKNFLEKENWNILNTYDNPTVSSLYGTKETNDINVTISENTSSISIQSRVSISILKKI